MPHFKINVNGEKYVISGMSNGACSKQLLYSLAKVNSPVQPRAKVNSQVEPRAKVSSQIEPRAKVSSQIEPRAKVNSQVESRAKVNSQIEPRTKVNSKIEPRANVKETTAFCNKGGSSKHSSTRVGNKSSTEGSEEVYKTLLILGKEKLKQKEDKTCRKLKAKRSSKKPHKKKQKPTNEVGVFPLTETTDKQEKLKRSKNPAKENFTYGEYKKPSFSWPKSNIYARKLGNSGKMERKPFTSESYEYLTDLVNAQRNCLKAQRRRMKEKEKKIKHYSKRLESVKTDETEQLIVNSDGAQSEGNKEKNERLKVDDKAVDTDHDTGISEQHSSDMDGTYETHSTLANKSPKVSVISFVDKEKIVESVEREQFESTRTSAGSQNGCSADVNRNELAISKLSEDSLRTSYVTVERTQVNTTNSNHDNEKEVGKIREDVKVLQSQLEKQNRVIDLLTNLLDQNKPVKQESVGETDDLGMEEQLKSLHSSISLSVELYDYQKSEMQANATALQHTEREIRRKRWHVASLRKHLNSLTICTHSRRHKRSREKYRRVSGTLV